MMGYSLGSRIKEIRKNAGMTQKQLASMIGVAPITIQQYEREVRNPAIPMLEKIANATGFTLSDILQTDDCVKVVRCKDCKHYHAETGWCDIHSHFVDDEDGACHPWESAEWKMFNENYFCADGERRTYEP